MITRRRLLATGMAGWGLSLLSPRRLFAQQGGSHTTPAATTLNLSVDNQTGRYANSAIWLYAVGVNLSTGHNSYLRADGSLAACSLADNGADGYTDYAIPLAASGITSLVLPNMSGRIYVAINQKLKIRIVADAGQPGGVGVQMPAGWVANDANYSILHDWIEFTFDGGGMYCNTTMVDMFSIPLALRLTGQNVRESGALHDGGRDAIFDALASNPDFSNLIVGDRLRVLAPGHGINAGRFASDYLASYIDACWSHYQTHSLTIQNQVFGTFTGSVSAGSQLFEFRQGGNLITSFAKPTTRDVFFCDGALIAPNNVGGALAAVLGAALNRTTLQTIASQPAANPATFYQNARTNHYARVMHTQSVDGRAYGFAFDDVADFSSYIADPAPTALRITVGPFGRSDQLFRDGFQA